MAEEAGVIELVARREGGNSATLMKVHSSAVSGAALAPDYQKLKHRIGGGPIVNGGAFIDLIFTSEAVDIVESEESSLQVAIFRNGNPDMLVLEDFDGFKPSGTNDHTFTEVNQRITLGSYRVPSGDKIKMNAQTPVHIFIGDDT